MRRASECVVVHDLTCMLPCTDGSTLRAWCSRHRGSTQQWSGYLVVAMAMQHATLPQCNVVQGCCYSTCSSLRLKHQAGSANH